MTHFEIVDLIVFCEGSNQNRNVGLMKSANDVISVVKTYDSKPKIRLVHRLVVTDTLKAF